MQKITIYTKKICPYCIKAKELLRIKGIKQEDINEFDISSNENLLMEMVTKSSGRKTVPQIFIGNTHIGGCDDLYALNTEGKLDEYLQKP